MTDQNTEGNLRDLSRRIDDLTAAMERASLAEYVELVRRPWRMAYINFLAGVARGFGTAVGFTILGALVVYLLQHLFVQNLPWVGSRLADLVKIVQIELRAR